jgi:K+-transporting ATPase ATPase C chain
MEVSAEARMWAEEQVRRLVAANTVLLILRFLGEPRVNVLLLNLALDREMPDHGGRQAPRS